MSQVAAATVLTGATSGIGEALAHRLAGTTGRLILLGPEPEEAVSTVLAGIRRDGNAEMHYVSADFSQLRNVRKAATEILGLAPDISVLINNAGAPGAPARVITTDGNERTLQVNALAPALLTSLLRPALHTGSRIVNVGSSAHRVESFDFDDPNIDRRYSPTVAYTRSKLAVVTWSLILADALQGSGIDVISLCPGLNDTPLSAAMMGHIGGPPSNGAARVLYATTAAVPSGTYLENDAPSRPSSDARDPGNQQRLTELLFDRLRQSGSFELA